jgi:AmmeMemoRadiSam system protein B
MNSVNPIRPSPIAGSWYPDDKKKLSAEIKGYLENAIIPGISGQIIGLITPHAGYFYSGETAGYAYRCLEGMDFDVCIVVSPLHDYKPEPLLTSAHDYYSTPLGDIEITKGFLAKSSSDEINSQIPYLHPIANDREHSLEIQLPFLQTALAKPFTLVPIMVRTNDPEILQSTARRLAEEISLYESKSKKVLLVASTDLSHFYSENVANRYDEYMLDKMAAFSPEGVLEAEASHQGFACGAGAVALVLWTAKLLGANKVTILYHSTSAKASGDISSVVGYGAAVITRQE